jgi:hypothetical protein
LGDVCFQSDTPFIAFWDQYPDAGKKIYFVKSTHGTTLYGACRNSAMRKEMRFVVCQVFLCMTGQCYESTSKDGKEAIKG